MGCGSGMGLGWGDRGENKNVLFTGYAVYAHYFNDIRQVALQCDCVMFLGGVLGMTGLGMRLSWGWFGCEGKRCISLGHSCRYC